MGSETFIEYPTDGCSAGVSKIWKLLFGNPPSWEYCCDLHDVEYWEGITFKDRLLADKRLFSCLYPHGKLRATIYFIVLRTFGWIYFNFLE